MFAFFRFVSFSLFLSLYVAAYPVQAVLDALAVHRRARLYVPRAVSDRVQAEAFGDVAGTRRVHQVLFVGEYEHGHAH
jgi:hypothetical protein